MRLEATARCWFLLVMGTLVACDCGGGRLQGIPGPDSHGGSGPVGDSDGDGVDDALDCEATDPSVFPGAGEVPHDGVDQDCDGEDLLDFDGDGFEGPSGIGPDCDDSRAEIHPGAPDRCGDSVDQDCDGRSLSCDPDPDRDGDGYLPGADCSDADAGVHPGAAEIPYDGVDQDCDGADLNDVDGDGSVAVRAGGPDCDDANPAIGPGAAEVCSDGIDQDCSGSDLDCATLDLDGDGYAPIGGDCDDADPTRHPGALEIVGDGIDQNCDGRDLETADADGDCYRSIEVGGADCDDGDALTHPGAEDPCGDGIDRDCTGADPVCPTPENDADGDGAASRALGGDDCDDGRSDVRPGAPDDPTDGDDTDCSGREGVGERILVWPVRGFEPRVASGPDGYAILFVLDDPTTTPVFDPVLQLSLYGRDGSLRSSQQVTQPRDLVQIGYPTLVWTGSSFLAAWYEGPTRGDGHGYAVIAQRFDETGASLGPRLDLGWVFRPDALSAGSAGGLVLIASDHTDDAFSNSYIAVASVDPADAVIPFARVSETLDSAGAPHLTGGESGFLASWLEVRSVDEFGEFGRLLDATGAPVAPAFEIAAPAVTNEPPLVQAAFDGANYVLVYEDLAAAALAGSLRVPPSVSDRSLAR